MGRHILGQNSPGCASQYGYNRAAQDVAWLSSEAKLIDGHSPPPPIAVSAAASSYLWWLDVETGNTWQSGSSGLPMNVADLQGMIYELHSASASVGAYSTSYQWGQITGGTTSASGSLYGIPDWVPGASSLAGAQSNCTLTSFTGGTIPVTQWFAGPYDGDNPC